MGFKLQITYKINTQNGLYHVYKLKFAISEAFYWKDVRYFITLFVLSRTASSLWH